MCSTVNLLQKPLNTDHLYISITIANIDALKMKSLCSDTAQAKTTMLPKIKRTYARKGSNQLATGQGEKKSPCCYSVIEKPERFAGCKT